MQGVEIIFPGFSKAMSNSKTFARKPKGIVKTDENSYLYSGKNSLLS